MMTKAFKAWVNIFFIVAILTFLLGLYFDKYLGGYPTPTPLRSGLYGITYVGLPLSVIVTVIYLAIDVIYNTITKK
jgi:hypothetical protein